MIDIYACYDAQQLDRVLGILAEGSIEPLVREHASNAFPVSVGLTAEKIVAVEETDADQARALLRTAVDDGVLPGDGLLLETQD